MAKMPKVELEVSITTDNEVAADLLLDHGFERQAVHVRKADRLERMMDAMFERYMSACAGHTVRGCRVCGVAVDGGPTICDECVGEVRTQSEEP